MTRTLLLAGAVGILMVSGARCKEPSGGHATEPGRAGTSEGMEGTSGGAQSMPAIVAHRGASAEAPENTVASARLGWRQGADAVEVDVYLTRDGKIVAIHDDTTKRTTGVDLRVRDHDLADLRALDAGRWKGEAFKGERIPTLDEILATVPPGKRLFVEIKCKREILPELERVLGSSTPDGASVTIIGFDHDTVAAAKKELGLETYWLSGWKRDERTKEVLTDPDDLVRRAVAAGVDGLGLAHDGPIDERFVRAIRDAGLRLNVWTVNDAEVAGELLRLGADSITTDRPGWLRDELRSRGDPRSREELRSLERVGSGGDVPSGDEVGFGEEVRSREDAAREGRSR